jgi:DNA replicative helicase MCM subunit Mcm2 (Cdc46/Mcm family)
MDIQMLILEGDESSDDIPRQLKLTISRELVNKFRIGNIVSAVGIYTVSETLARRRRKTSQPYLEVVGLKHDIESIDRPFTEEEIAEFVRMSRENIYEVFSYNIGRYISGYSGMISVSPNVIISLNSNTYIQL